MVQKRIGLGTWSWGNQLFWDYQMKNDEELFATFQEAVKRRFYFIDTADSYGIGKLNGRSEELLGKFTKKTSLLQKNRINIATKLAPYPWRIGKNGFTKPFLKSLGRLNNKLNIVQLHWSTAKYFPFQELQLLENLSDLVDQGYDFQIGLSNVGPKRLQQIIEYLALKGKKVKSVQVQYSLLSPELEKQRLVKKICEQNNIDFLAYSPLSFGLLCYEFKERKYHQKSKLRNFLFSVYEKPTYELRSLIKSIAEARSVSMAQVAINWCCYQNAVPIVGIRKRQQVIDISGVLRWDLNIQEFEMLETASRKCLMKLPGNPFTSN